MKGLMLLIIFIHQSPINLSYPPINLTYPHVFLLRNECAQSWKKDRPSKKGHIFRNMLPKIEKYAISQKRNSFVIGNFYRSKNLIT